MLDLMHANVRGLLPYLRAVCLHCCGTDCVWDQTDGDVTEQVIMRVLLAAAIHMCCACALWVPTLRWHKD